MVIFPEGTVSNGESLLDFKKGAFVIDCQLKVTGLKYSSSYYPSMMLMSLFDHFIGCLCNFYSHATYISINGLVSYKPNPNSPKEKN